MKYRGGDAADHVHAGEPTHDDPCTRLFAIGTVPVSCEATDAAGNVETCSLTVKVNSVEDVIDDLDGTIAALAASGDLNTGTPTSLDQLLLNLSRSIDADLFEATCAQSAALARRVDFLVTQGTLEADAAERLVEGLAAIRAVELCEV